MIYFGSDSNIPDGIQALPLAAIWDHLPVKGLFVPFLFLQEDFVGQLLVVCFHPTTLPPTHGFMSSVGELCPASHAYRAPREFSGDWEWLDAFNHDEARSLRVTPSEGWAPVHTR